MILECPECRARFLIADAALGARGRNVRCGRCRHQWHQDPLVGTTAIGPLPEPANDMPPLPDFLTGQERAAQDEAAMGGVVYDERRVPALRPRQPAPIWMRLAASATLAASLLLALVAHAPWIEARLPALRPVLSGLGALPAAGLVLSDVAFGQKAEANGVRYALGCSVRNAGTRTQDLPDLRLRISGRSGGLVMDAHRLLAPIARIAPGDEVPCDIPPITLRTGAARQILLDLGSPLSLALRR